MFYNALKVQNMAIFEAVCDIFQLQCENYPVGFYQLSNQTKQNYYTHCVTLSSETFELSFQVLYFDLY